MVVLFFITNKRDLNEMSRRANSEEKLAGSKRQAKAHGFYELSGGKRYKRQVPPSA